MSTCWSGNRENTDQVVDVEYGEEQGNHEGSKGSQVIILWVGDFSGDRAMQAGS